MRSSVSRNRSFKFKYQGRTEKQVRERTTMSSGSYDRFVKDGVTVFKPKSGDNVIRILPPGWENAKHFGLDLWVHNGIGPDRASYLCNFKMKGEPCPICEGRQYATTDDESSALKPTRRVGVFLLDRDDMKLGPQFWSMPAEKMDKEIVARCFNKKTKRVLMVDHPDEGYDVEFIKEGEKRNTVYRAVEISRDQSPISRNEEKQQEILKYVTKYAIPKILKFYDYDYIEQVFNVKQPEKDSKMARRKAALKKDTTPKKRGRGRSVEDDEDDLDEIDEDELEEALDDLDDEDEDEDEEPAPRRRRAKKAAPAKAKAKRGKKVIEEEDEDEDDLDDLDDEDEDEDDEPAPKKRRAALVKKKRAVPVKKKAVRRRR